MEKKYFFVIFALIYILVIIFNNNRANRIIFCNVGQGDGAMIQRGKYQILVDVGKDGQMMAECLSRYMPINDKKIDEIIISHQDNDHNGGLVMLKKYYEIGLIRFGGVENNESYVFKYLGKNNEYWFTGDIDSIKEKEVVIDKANRKRILKVGHHGSRFSTSEDFLSRLTPDTAIISVGKNFYGHPNKIIIDRLVDRGIKVFRTDRWGDVIFED